MLLVVLLVPALVAGLLLRKVRSAFDLSHAGWQNRRDWEAGL